MKYDAIIQCRFKSTRLQGKILLPLNEKLNSLDFLIINLKSIKQINRIILAVPRDEASFVFDKIAKRHKVNFCSPICESENVLKRFYLTSKKFNSKRFRANLIEAAEQCDFNNIPEIREPENFKNILTNWDNLLGDSQVIFCDEKSTLNAFDLLQNQKYEGKKWSIIIGPEGGFSETERNLINKKNNSLNISLGPRILRSDTAAVAVLSIFQLIIGDWNN